MSRPDILIRRADIDDLGAVLAVLASKRTGEGDDIVPSDLEQRTWTEMLERRGLTTYLAVIDGRVVGTTTLLVLPNLTYACAPTAFVEAVVVLPSHRRQGCATAMLERLLADAKGEGCNKVQLLSHKRHVDDGVFDLYRKVGFEPEAEGFRRYLGPVPVRS